MDSHRESGRFAASKSLDPVGVFGQKPLDHTFHTSPPMKWGRESSKMPENPIFVLYKDKDVILFL